MQLEGVAGRDRIYKGLFGTLRHIVHPEGFRGLCRGILPKYCKWFCSSHAVESIEWILLRCRILLEASDGCIDSYELFCPVAG